MTDDLTVFSRVVRWHQEVQEASDGDLARMLFDYAAAALEGRTVTEALVLNEVARRLEGREDNS